jgi:hypothetical protein
VTLVFAGGETFEYFIAGSPTHGDENEGSDAADDEEEEETESNAPVVTCLQPDDLAQYIADNHEDEILCVAPAEGNRPQSVRDKEAAAFPTLFPDGKNTFSEKRDHKLSFSQYVKSRLLSATGHFARNPDYIFYLQFVKEFEEVLSSAKISVRKGSSSGDVTAGQLTSTEAVRKMFHKNEGYKFLTKVRGSAPYWEKAMRDLCATVKQLSIPTWFASFSAADRRWTEIAEAIMSLQGKTLEGPLDWAQHCAVINSNPVVAAIMFDKRARYLINDFIKSPAAPIGIVQDYFYRIEFQQRGWPHIHALFWVKDAPKLSATSTDGDKAVEQFIDKYITCVLPSEEENEELHEKVSNLQRHSKKHSKACKKGRKECRFNFPRPPSTRTFICRPILPPEGMDSTTWKENATDKLKTFWEMLGEESSDMSAQDLLQAAGITQDEFEHALGCLATKVSIVLKREPDECWVNQYNPHLLRAGDANIDIQFVVDAYSCICYIVSYVSKKESEEGHLLKAAQKEAREGNEDAVSELRTLGRVYLTHREVSIMEAIWRATGLNLKSSSREVKWIPVDEESSRMSLPLALLKKIARQKGDDCTEVWLKSDVERYWARPKTREFENMCLATFVANFKLIQHGRHDDDSDAEDAGQVTSGHAISLQDGMGAIMQRKKPIVIRYLKISESKDPERHFKNLLRMYLPHRGKDFKPTDYDTYEAYFSQAQILVHDEMVPMMEVVQDNQALYEHDASVIDDAWEDIQAHGIHEDAWAQVAPLAEQQRHEDELERPEDEIETDEQEEGEVLPDLEVDLPSTSAPTATRVVYTEKLTSSISKAQAHKMMRDMNFAQRQIFLHLRKWCLQKAQGVNVDPFHIFLTGGAGTGKSHVINAFRYEAERLLTALAESADDVTVLVLAYTGTAAFNVGGQTIHSALAIQSDSMRKGKYKSLAEDKLTELRATYRNLQLILIDEISMVGKKMFTHMSERLNQIKHCRDDVAFGNISVLAVGDFFQISPIADTSLHRVDPGELYVTPWHTFEIWELTEIMRQKDDRAFAEMLNGVRCREKNAEMSAEHQAILSSRVFAKESIPDDILHIFSLNADVDGFNDQMLHSSCPEIITISAVDILQLRQGKTKRRAAPAPKKGLSLAPVIHLAESARVMLIKNLDVRDGLSNGVTGTIVKIVPGRMPLGQPEAVWIIFDEARVGGNTRHKVPNPPDVPPNSIKLQSQQEFFEFQGNKVTRYQYPLRLAWACTIHKTQGMTVPAAAVSLSRIFASGMGYVALSRVSTIQGLYIQDFEDKRLYCDRTVPLAMSSMTKLNCDSMPLLQPFASVDSFRVAAHNIHSLPAHFPDLQRNIELLNVDILGITETWLSPSHQTKHYMLPGFKLVRLDRADGTGGGGVAVYIRDHFQIDQLIPGDVANFTGLEAILVRVAENLTIGIVYRPPNLNKDAFCDKLQDLLSAVPASHSVVLTGDFNHDILDNPHQPVFQPLVSYTQVITEATYYAGRGYTSLLDHIYTKNVSVVQAGNLQTYYSDHDPVYATVSIQK